MRRPALALLLGCLLLVAGVSAIDGYSYYQTIEYAATDKDVYQQDIVVHRSAGTAYNETSGGLETWHIYVGDHCREDYGDIRFTNSTGAELAYYLWPDYTNSSARFCVRLENATAAGTLVVHYGNATATTTSDPGATYFLFDNFSDSSLDTQIWSWSGNVVEVVNGELHLKSTGSWTDVSTVNLTPLSNITIEMRWRVKANANEGNGISLVNSVSDQNCWYAFRAYSTGRLRLYTRSGGTWAKRWESPSSVTLNTNYRIKIIDTGSTVTLYLMTDAGAAIANSGSKSYDSLTTGYLSLSEYRSGDEGYFDDVIIRAYSATPPAALAFSGERETAAPLQPFPGCSNDPTDPDADGLYEDINGNARWDFQDIILFFQHLTWCEANQPVSLFDWNSNGRCDFDDVFRLWSNGGMI